MTACASGSPKRTLYSMSRGPSVVQHQPGIDHTDVRGARRDEVIEHRLHEGRQEVVGRVRDRRRSVGAHAARVRAGVGLTDALVVLGQRQRDSGGAVAQSEQGALGATKPLLEQERSWPGGGDRGTRLVRSVRHDDAFAGEQSVGFHHDVEAGRAPTTQVRSRRRRSWRTRGPGMPSSVARSRAIGLGRFEPSEVGGRSETRNAAGGALVGEPGGECCLRTGDHQIDVSGRGVAEFCHDAHVVTVLACKPRRSPLRVRR